MSLRCREYACAIIAPFLSACRTRHTQYLLMRCHLLQEPEKANHGMSLERLWLAATTGASTKVSQRTDAMAGLHSPRVGEGRRQLLTMQCDYHDGHALTDGRGSAAGVQGQSHDFCTREAGCGQLSCYCCKPRDVTAEQHTSTTVVTSWRLSHSPLRPARSGNEHHRAQLGPSGRVPPVEFHVPTDGLAVMSDKREKLTCPSRQGCAGEFLEIDSINAFFFSMD